MTREDLALIQISDVQINPTRQIRSRPERHPGKSDGHLRAKDERGDPATTRCGSRAKKGGS